MNVEFQITDKFWNKSLSTKIGAMMRAIFLILAISAIADLIDSGGISNNIKIISVLMFISVSLFYSLLVNAAPNTFYIVFDDQADKYYIRWQKFRKWNIFVDDSSNEYAFNSLEESIKILGKVLIKL